MSLSSVNIAPAVEEIVNKILWTVVRFVLLTAEISVLIFSLAFGHLESRHSIRAVLITTGIISLVFSVIQGQYLFTRSHSAYYDLWSRLGCSFIVRFEYVFVGLLRFGLCFIVCC